MKKSMLYDDWARERLKLEHSIVETLENALKETRLLDVERRSLLKELAENSRRMFDICDERDAAVREIRKKIVALEEKYDREEVFP